MAKLTTEARNNLSASDFALPETREFPIHDRAHAVDALARAAGKPVEAQVRAAVKRKYPDMKVKKMMLALEVAKAAVAASDSQPGDVAISVPLWKDDSKQNVYGVVLTPGLVDSQDDEVSPDEIEKAAHRFLVEFRKHDVQHTERPEDVQTVESYIAPCDFELAGEKVLKGSWVLVTHVGDPETWERVQKGELTGYSIGGSGERIPIAA